MTYQDERGIEAALKAVREQTRGEQAGPTIESCVLAEFRAQKSVVQSSVRWWFVGAVAAGLVVAVATAFTWSSVRTQRNTGPADVAHQEQIIQRLPAPELPVQIPAKRVFAGPRHLRHTRPQRLRTAAAEGVPSDVGTDFVPIAYAAPLAANESAQVMRVRLPRASLRNFGIPVEEDRASDGVRADVLLGGDGVVRAVRFLR
jgi:hypothetical protein